jgi:hypothetical protein
LFSTRSAAKKVEPANHDNGQPDDAHRPLFIRDKSSFHEERLYQARPNNEQQANQEIDETV